MTTACNAQPLSTTYPFPQTSSPPTAPTETVLTSTPITLSDTHLPLDVLTEIMRSGSFETALCLELALLRSSSYRAAVLSSRRGPLTFERQLVSIRKTATLTLLKNWKYPLGPTQNLSDTTRSISSIIIHYPPNDQSLNDVSKVFSRLRSLTIKDSSSLESFSVFCKLTSLNSLKLYKCTNLCHTAGIGALKNLMELELDGCKKLVHIVDFHLLPHLKTVSLVRCFKLRKLVADSEIPLRSTIPQVKTIGLFGSKNLTDISLLRSLTTLKQLTIVECAALQPQSYAHLQPLTSLRTLELCKLHQLTTLRWFENFGLLEELSLYDFYLQNISGIHRLGNLRKLSLGDCFGLESIDDLKYLPHLQEVVLVACPHLRDYSSLSSLKSLILLSLASCEHFNGLEILDPLDHLNMLYLTGQFLHLPDREQIKDWCTQKNINLTYH